MRKIAWVLAVASALLPAIILWQFGLELSPIEPTSAFDPKAEHYPEAIERLENTSQMLVTITLATLGAAGLIVTRSSSVLQRGAAASVFFCSVASLYCATKLGYAAALTLAADKGDITRIAPLLDSQALAALVAGFVLGGMAIFSGGADQGRA
jgi:hypothetical protein